jgi:hypothetical protein
MAQWLWMRYGLSDWKARRWIASAHALESLPVISEAFASGELGIDKVAELTRLATPQTEAGLIGWACRVSPGAIRHRGDLQARHSLQEAQDCDRARSLRWWYFDQGRRFGLSAELPASEGAVVAKALRRLAHTLPVMPGEEDPSFVEARRADALVMMCSARISEDPQPDRATVVVHAPLESLISGEGGCEIDSDGVIHPQSAARLLCESRIQMVVQDGSNQPVGVGRLSREPSSFMMRLLRYRDRECMYPGCGARRFLRAHHIVFWKHGGRTDLANLVLLCHFHHKLVHEYRWRISRDPDGTVRWFRPDGTLHRAGPAPPRQRVVVTT